MEMRAIARKYSAHDIRIFSSETCGVVGESSDLDLIVRFDLDRSLLDHGCLLVEL